MTTPAPALRVNAEVDLREVLANLPRLQRAAEADALAFWREMQSEVKAELRSHRQRLRKRSAATRREHGRGRTLGKALTAYKGFPSSSGLLMRSLIDYSGVLNDGGRVGNAAVLPERNFAFLPDAFVQDTAERYARFIVARGWG